MILDTVDEKKKGVHTRYLILLIIFIVTAVNYADRATLSIAGTEVAKELQLSAVSMGYIFSAFGWAYLLMQIPGGWLLDKFGSKKVYTYSLFFWSLFTFLQGFVDMFPLAWAGISMFFMRFMLGFSEAPSFPANARIVAAVPDEKNVVLPPPSLTRRKIFLAGALFASAWLADFRLGLGARLYRYGGDWFCADGAVDQIDS